MKYFTFLLFALVFFTTSCKQSNEQNHSKQAESTVEADVKTVVPQVANRIEVLDFYGVRRCKTCRAIEANSRYTLDTYFAEAMKEGKIVFRVVNTDEEKNAEIAEKFEAFGTALFLNVIKDGHETIIELTDFAFQKGNDRDVFSKELKDKIEEQLKNL